MLKFLFKIDRQQPKTGQFSFFTIELTQKNFNSNRSLQFDLKFYKQCHQFRRFQSHLLQRSH